MPPTLTPDYIEFAGRRLTFNQGGATRFTFLVGPGDCVFYIPGSFTHLTLYRAFRICIGIEEFERRRLGLEDDDFVEVATRVLADHYVQLNQPVTLEVFADLKAAKERYHAAQDNPAFPLESHFWANIYTAGRAWDRVDGKDSVVAFWRRGDQLEPHVPTLVSQVLGLRGHVWAAFLGAKSLVPVGE